jgi:hypothetical protein
VPEGNGSGFVWSKEGHIITNYHVLANILNGVGQGAFQRKDFKVCSGGSNMLQVPLLLLGMATVLCPPRKSRDLEWIL